MTKHYLVKEVFDTIQGEGGRAGQRSVFVRFAGCNMWNGDPDARTKGKGACALWCDTDFRGGVKMTATQIAEKVLDLWPGKGNEYDQKWIVLTGGEPALQLDMEFCNVLQQTYGILIAMETNGSILNSAVEAVAWLSVSPKLDAFAVRSDFVVRAGHELKVVLPGAADDEDGWTDAMLDDLIQTTRFKRYYVQPQDAIDPVAVDRTWLKGGLHSTHFSSLAQLTYERSVSRCVEFVKAHPQWRLSLQTHKMIAIP